ncbi:MAG: DUF4433 domain-containing protein [Rubrobacteraceae bacterium]
MLLTYRAFSNQARYTYCKSRLSGAQKIDISHYDIQQVRQRKKVQCGPGGVLHDYVPFYLAPSSPMMFAISKGNVEKCSSNTERLVYFVSSLDKTREANSNFVFSDGHATKAFTRIYDDLVSLNKIDWPLMQEQYWSDTKEDPDRSRRRQAEFLVHETFSWEAVEYLAVKTPNMKRRLDKYLSEEWPHRIKPVRVESDWYFP